MSAQRSSLSANDAGTRLEAGDVMTRPEFHRRYALHPEIRSAELIEGVVYVEGRVSARDHGEQHAAMVGWLGGYSATHTVANAASRATVILDQANEVQPDVVLIRDAGGSSGVSADGYIEGPPELIVEISASSTSQDLHQKKNAYRRNGVQEYIVWRVLDGAIDWFALQDGQYVALSPNASGVIESAAFPGLRLDVAAMLAGDISKVVAVQSSAD